MRPVVLLDDRVGSRELLRHPPLHKIATLQRLDSADVCFAGNGPDGKLLIGVEVKSIRDFLSSVATGRLQATQVPRMLDHYDVVWVAIYGLWQGRKSDNALQLRVGKTWRQYKVGRSPLPVSYVEGMLLDLAALGIGVRTLASRAEVARWLGIAADWWAKPWERHKGMRTLDHSKGVSLLPGMDEDEHLRARIAHQVPGVGFERAVAIAKAYPSVPVMIAAGVNGEWGSVEGVGPVTSRVAQDALR